MSLFQSLLSDKSYPAYSACTKFDSLLNSNAAATARVVALEPTSANNAKSWSVWYKPNNINKKDERIFTISDNSGIAVQLLLYGNESLTVPNKLLYQRNGNGGGTINISATATTSILRNRWNHIVTTDAGGTSNSGLKIYVNGVLLAVTLGSAGVFVSTYSTGTNRIVLGRSFSSGSGLPAGGLMRDATCFDRVITQAEVTELYSYGEPIADITTISFYANVVDHWYLKSNFVGVKIATTLTGSNTAFTTSRVGSRVQNISWKKIEATNTRYVAFGKLVNLGGDSWAYYARSATSHLLNGNMYKAAQNLKSFGTDCVITTPFTELSTQHVSGVAAGPINGSVFLFFSRYNDSTVSFVDTGRRVSNDGLTGESFDALITMPTTYPRYEFYGCIAPGFSAGHFFIPFFEHNNGVEWRISHFKTEDNGATWAKTTIFEDTTLKLGEPFILNAGNNTLICVARSSAAGKGGYQTVSTDGGVTWSAPVKINLASTGDFNCAMTLTPTGITMLYMDRTEQYFRISRNNSIVGVIADPTTWNAGEIIGRSYATDSYLNLGYPHIKYIGNGKYVMTIAHEFSSSRADSYIAYGELEELGT